ncbi:MAG: LuxR C-terminal-related transcriptional regulator [Syntrophobacteraceae bacterium]|jgi:PAS domain S-box-containing protein
MQCTISHRDLNQRVTELHKGVLNTTQTERKAVWERLLAEPLIDELPAGFALFNEDFVLLKCNRTYGDFIRRHTPYTAEKAVGMSHFDYKPGSEKFSGTWFRYVRDSGRGESCYDFELGVLKDGRYAMSHWDVHLSPVTDQAGRLAGTAMYCLDVTERKAIKKDLVEEEVRLAAVRPGVEEMKTALRVLLALREEDRSQLERRLLTNLEQTLSPWIERLKRTRMDIEQKTCVDLIESSLTNITSSLANGVSSGIAKLTAREMEVVQLLKLGKTSKEIASLLGVCKECVDFHRNNLRKKLGLNKQKVSLRTHLYSLSQGGHHPK